MRKSSIFLFVIFLFTGCFPFLRQTPHLSPHNNPEITAGEISDHVKFLAADALRGRYPGTPGSDKAVEYITRRWAADGILPAGENGYKQTFDFTNRIELGEDNSLIINNRTFAVGEDFIPLGFSANGDLTADAAFVGYGFTIDDSIQWNDYSGLDVTGKWVIIIRGGPDADNPHSPFDPHTPLRKKVLVARDHKAGGVLFVSQPEEEGGLIPLKFDYDFSGAGIPVIHLSSKTAKFLFSTAGKDLPAIIAALNRNQSPRSFLLGKTTISATVELVKNTTPVPNLIGLIPGNDPVLRDEYVIIGAHFDHLGLGGPGTNSTQSDTIAVHNGADDNASGVAGILEIGQKLAANRENLRRSVLLICFNAEEEGLLGSKFFVNNPTIDLEKVSAMINLDMIGRMTDSSLVIGGTGTSPIFEPLLNELNRGFNLSLKFNNEGYGPSDHAGFYTNDIPVLFFFTGIHRDYHKPSDDWDRINIFGEKLVADYVYDLVLYLSRLDEKPQFTAAGPKEPTVSRRSFKVTLGIIPAYGSQAEGLEIDGTRKAGPAEKAGLKKGDIIIAIDEKGIKNIYDYMYRLEELKPGQTIIVKIKRGDEILELPLEL